MRKPHKLNQTKDSGYPKSVIFFDTETTTVNLSKDKKKLVLKLGVGVYARTVKGEVLKPVDKIIFYDPLDFWNWVDKKCVGNTTTYLVAHNIGFDLSVSQGFFSLLYRGWNLDSFYTKGITSIFRWSKGKTKLIGVDNTNLFPGTLQRWGSILGVEKLTVDFETVDDERLIIYCERDVEIMRRAWKTWYQFLDNHHCGGYKMTVGSTAFNTWRHAHMRLTVYIHNDPLALLLERESYHGGRTECFYQGRAPVDRYYYLDVNNMYGYVLSRFSYPYTLVRALETDKLEYLLRYLGKYAIIARVELEITEPWYPVKINGYTAYPIGRFVTTLTTPELILAYKRGWLRGISAMSMYKQGDLFSGYIKYFTDLRQRYKSEHNPGMENIAKLLVNSLYGKFGQTGLSQVIIGDVEPEEFYSIGVVDAQTGERLRHIALAGHLYEERKSGESYNSFPAIAAHVTAYARMLLFDMIQSVPVQHVYYCDTDSLIVDSIGYQSIKHKINPGVLGALKIEHESDTLTIHAPKDYEMGDRIRIKGIRGNAIPVDIDTYRQEKWYGLMGLIHEGVLDGAIVETIEKRQYRVIHSGSVGVDGWIHPFVLGSGSGEPHSILSLNPAER